MCSPFSVTRIDAALPCLGSGEEGGEVGAEAGRDENGGGMEVVDRGKELRCIIALGDDAHVVFKGQDTGGTGAEDRLIVGENKSIHGYLSLLPGSYHPVVAFIGEGGRLARQCRTIRTIRQAAIC